MEASESPLSDGRSKGAPTARGLTVLLSDPLESRLQVITRVVSDCGGVARRINELSGDELDDCAKTVSLAVVALTEPAAEPGALIRKFKEKDVRVICHGASANLWPLGVQCRPLLAGAWKLLDSEGEDFVEELRQLISKQLSEQLIRSEEESKTKLEMRRLGIVGQSKSLLTVFRWAARVSALSDLPALITGETGTGKELFARSIHQLDPKRRSGPFVSLNCGAINPGLVESELFGHRRGAFTGADRARRGLIRSAQSGVLFLDEIGELDPNAQTKLLRVLQENRVLAVGEDRETQIDIRVIAATNRDLDERVQTGSFRLDLFHRLDVLSVRIPPLRERAEDLGPLIEHFIARFRSVRPGTSLSVRPGFVQALARMELPGNARQLENLVRRILVDKDDDASLDLSDLPAEIWEKVSSETCPSKRAQLELQEAGTRDETNRDPSLEIGNLLDLHGWNLPRSLEYCEKLLVEAALRRADGNQSRTAQLLGITPRSVYNKLRKHGLNQH